MNEVARLLTRVMFLISLKCLISAEQIRHSFLSWSRRLRESVSLKRPGCLRTGVAFLHNNATRRTGNHARDLVQRYHWDVLDHPSYSAELVPSEFRLFGWLKKHPGGSQMSKRPPSAGCRRPHASGAWHGLLSCWCTCDGAPFVKMLRSVGNVYDKE